MDTSDSPERYIVSFLTLDIQTVSDFLEVLELTRAEELDISSHILLMSKTIRNQVIEIYAIDNVAMKLRDKSINPAILEYCNFQMINISDFDFDRHEGESLVKKWLENLLKKKYLQMLAESKPSITEAES